MPGDNALLTEQYLAAEATLRAGGANRLHAQLALAVRCGYASTAAGFDVLFASDVAARRLQDQPHVLVVIPQICPVITLIRTLGRWHLRAQCLFHSHTIEDLHSARNVVGRLLQQQLFNVSMDSAVAGWHGFDRV